MQKGYVKRFNDRQFEKLYFTYRYAILQQKTRTPGCRIKFQHVWKSLLNGPGLFCKIQWPPVLGNVHRTFTIEKHRQLT